MAKKEDRIKALEQKQEQIKAQIQALKQKDSVQERKNDTRRKVLLGGFMLAQMKKKAMKVEDLTYESVRFVDALKAERDRVLFGLKPLAASAALSPHSEAKGSVS